MPHVGRFLEPALVERLNQLQLTARRVVEGNTAGLHRSQLKGASVEFRQHRFYVPGDDPRRLDWRVLGRTNRPYIKEYDEETNLRGLILLDRSGSMAYAGASGEGRGARESKFDYASRLGAALAYLMLAQTESVGLGIFGEQIETLLPPNSGSGQLSRVIELLERASPRGKSDPSRAMQQAADRLERRGLVIVVSDFVSPVESLRRGLARLIHDRHEVMAIRVLDLSEREFPFKGWARFRGLEGERSQLCEAALVKKTYLANFRRHEQELEIACGAMRVELTTLTTDRAMEDAITTLLRRRRVSKLRCF
jgi:uncharacterized protein (DUF58 family)